MPDEVETYYLLRLGITLAEADEMPHARAQELLAIHRIVTKAEAR